MNIKVSIIVVLYNKEIEESTTIRTLLEKGLVNAHLTIHNNGPEQISIPQAVKDLFEERNVTFLLDNCVENKPLSNLYNDFISDNEGADKFILFDDDSEITQSFMDAIKVNDYDLKIYPLR